MKDLGVVGGFIAIFCRVGCCFLLLPGLASTRMPAVARLFLALGISLAVGPLLIGTAVPLDGVGSDLKSFVVMGKECAVGIAIGLIARFMFTAVQMTGALMAQVSGYGHPFTIEEGHGEPVSEVAALLSSGVLALLFMLDFHQYVVEAMIESYSVIGFGAGIEPSLELERLSKMATDSARLALSLSVPFVTASVLINLAFGMLNRMAPQIPVYFISSAFLMWAMLWMAFNLLPEMARASLAAVVASFQNI